MTDNAKKRRKLPDRYPREQATLIFGEMYELDHVLELLDSLGAYLADLPGDITEGEWGKKVSDPITSLVRLLRKAYTEYERFWNPSTWKPAEDMEFKECLEDHRELHWRIGEIKNEKIYDPARLACAEALELALLLKQVPGGKDWVDYCINSLRYKLTRYHAASLEVLLGRQAVFKSGRSKGATAVQTKHIQELVQKYRTESAKELRKLATSKIIGDMADGTFSNQVTAARKKHPKETRPNKKK